MWGEGGSATANSLFVQSSRVQDVTRSAAKAAAGACHITGLHRGASSEGRKKGLPTSMYSTPPCEQDRRKPGFYGFLTTWGLGSPGDLGSLH